MNLRTEALDSERSAQRQLGWFARSTWSGARGVVTLPVKLA